MKKQTWWRNLIILGLILNLWLAVAVFARNQSKVETSQEAFLPLISTADAPLKVLVFTKTEGFRHTSIPDGIEMIRTLGENNQFEIETSEDASAFTAENLANYAAVIFLSTTGDVLDASQEAAFEAYIQAGGGFVGIHAATDTEYDWPWYGQLVGTYFKNHPEIQGATLNVIDTSHLSTNHLSATWSRTDEWYNFRTDPSSDVNVLIQIDENSYSGGEMGESHPISWYHEFDGGRSWYTAMGHTSESYAEPDFQKHVLGGILWAATGDNTRLGTTNADENEPEAIEREEQGEPDEQEEMDEESSIIQNATSDKPGCLGR